MFKLNVGALRPARDDARNQHITAANDLVQRTLAQHGLVPGAGNGHTGPAGMPPSLDGLLSGLKTPFAGGAAPTVEVPAGAEFRTDRFSCASGSRDYRTYVPASATDGVAGVVLMLHGCTQTAEDFAIGTGMNALAEKHRLVVVYPQQSRGDNAQSCWNWFSRGDQQRERGEPAILAGIARCVAAEFDVTRDRTFVAGLSAGAAMAVVLGETYSDVFSAVGAHSGLPYGMATDVPSAFAAMAGNGPERSGTRKTGPAARTIVFHGTADATVHPSNGEGIARDALDRSAAQTIDTELDGTANGRPFRRRIVTAPDGSVELEHWTVEGLGHAWSGGQPGGSYTDARGPDASAEMIRFFLNEMEL